jgi:hypothetical protein
VDGSADGSGAGGREGASGSPRRCRSTRLVIDQPPCPPPAAIMTAIMTATYDGHYAGNYEGYYDRYYDSPRNVNCSVEGRDCGDFR